jgi:hypothetical protein
MTAKGLFDSGGTQTFVNSCCLPKGATPLVVKNPLQGLTAAGCFTASRMVELKDIVRSEFSRAKHINDQWAFVFDAPSQYNIVFSRDFLLKIGLDTSFSMRTTDWLEQKLQMKKSGFWWEDPVSMYLALMPYVKENKNKEAECNCFSKIKVAKYEKVVPREVTKGH